MSRWTLTVLVVIGMAGTARAAQAQPADPIAAPGQGQPTIVLHVMNYAALSRDVLDATMARVARVYTGIGVRTVWVESERSADQGQNSPLHLSILLLSRDRADKKISAEGTKDGVLGQAHPPSGRASIFCERIATMPGARRSFPVPLGDVIAHEVGHLVLGTNTHSRSGIMRANANVHAMHLQTFDELQARTIRTVLMKLTNTSGQPLIRVMLVDHAEVPHDTLQRAQNVATHVFHLSGLALIWVAGTCPARCLTVRIVTEPVTAQSRRDPHILGVAPSMPDARGIMLWIFYPRIRAYSAKLGMDASQLLGHAMAHELGHLLLPQGAHSLAGLMRGEWDRAQVRAAVAGLLTFTPDQAGLIREGLQASASPTARAR